MKKAFELKQERQKLLDEERAAIEAVEKENRDFTEDEDRASEERMKQIDALTALIAKREKLENLKDVEASDLPDDEARSLDGDLKDAADEFREYIVRGVESRALNVSTEGQGGYLAPAAFYGAVVQSIKEQYPLVGMVYSMDIKGYGSLGVPYDKNTWDDGEWTAEIPDDDKEADSSSPFGERSLSTNSLVKYVEISKQMLNKSGIAIEAYLIEKLAGKFGKALEKAILYGSGTGQPVGVFNTGIITTGQDVTNDSATTAPSFDAIASGKAKLKAAGVKNIVMVIHPDVEAEFRKLKDDNKQYLWQPSPIEGEPDKIHGIPLVFSNYAPATFEAGSYYGIMGDFSKYFLVSSADFSVQRLNEVGALRNKVGFLGYGEYDGTPIVENAFVRLKTAGTATETTE